MLIVNEIKYDCTQGEGLNIGLPMSYIRFEGCNLNCYNCDTKYALQGDSSGFTAVELFETVAAKTTLKTIMLTGGEPVIQDANDMLTLVGLFKGHGWKVWVESNCTAFPSWLHAVDHIVFSPKLPNMYAQVVDMEKFAAFLRMFVYGHVELKFVVHEPWEVLQILGFQDKLADMGCYIKDVTVQPNNNDLRILNAVIMEYPQREFRVLPQLHKLLGVS